MIVMKIIGTSGSVMFGPLPLNRRRRYTLTIEATAGDETMIIERRFRSGTLALQKLMLIMVANFLYTARIYNRNYW